MTGKSLVVLVAVLAALVGAGIGTASAGVEKLYALDCGQNLGKDHWAAPSLGRRRPLPGQLDSQARPIESRPSWKNAKPSSGSTTTNPRPRP